MRLKHDDDPPVERARGGDDRGNLRRMVTVVVHDEDAVRLAADVEAALGAAEVLQSCGDAIERQAQFHPDGDGRQRVLQVVPSRHDERERAERRPALAVVASAIVRVAPADGRGRR